jgi:hypothetical protein
MIKVQVDTSRIAGGKARYQSREKADRAMRAYVEAAVREAKQKAPKRPGDAQAKRLGNEVRAPGAMARSIRWDKQGPVFAIKADAPAWWIENGTVKAAAQPFLRPAVDSQEHVLRGELGPA